MPMRRTLLGLLLLALTLATMGCSGDGGPSVSGQVVVPKATAYPVGSVLSVRVSALDASPLEVVGEHRQRLLPGWEAPQTHPPVAFEVPYDAADIDPERIYVLSAEITDGNEVLATSSTRPAVITQGAPTTGIELPLR